ncbi:MAG: GNAT family N-acetyltransferase [Pyrinomonadaceae bacterium]
MLPAGAKKAQGPEIRLATPDDAAAIAGVLFAAFSPNREHYTPEAFDAVTLTPESVLDRLVEGPIWVAELDNEVVGTVSLTTEPEGLYVRSMAIKPSAQRMGIAKRLLDVIDEHAAANGYERIFLYTSYFILGAKELYEKQGFKWVRDTEAEEWHGTLGLEMDKKVERKTQNVARS